MYYYTCVVFFFIPNAENRLYTTVRLAHSVTAAHVPISKNFESSLKKFIQDILKVSLEYSNKMKMFLCLLNPCFTSFRIALLRKLKQDKEIRLAKVAKGLRRLNAFKSVKTKF